MEKTTATPQAGATTSAAPEATIKVKFNHEEREIPASEAAVLAQKGMNYDKVFEKLQSVEAQLQGYTSQIGDYQKREVQRGADDRVRQLVGGGLDEAIAKQLVEAETKASMTEQELTQLKAQAAIDNQIKTFVSERPDVDLSKIPDEVIAAAKKSGNLLKEFNAWESGVLRAKVKDLETQLGVKQTNQENTTSSMGGATTVGSAAPGEITEESIKAMTSEQRKAQLSDKNSPLWKFLNRPPKK